ncbi:MAG: hypothetical protein AAGH92_09145 [Planctomycetota bacterium]
MQSQKFTGRVSNRFHLFRTGRVATAIVAGVAVTGAAVFAAPDARAGFNRQYDTKFDNRFFDFDQDVLFNLIQENPDFVDALFTPTIPRPEVVPDDVVMSGMLPPGQISMDDEGRTIVQPPTLPPALPRTLPNAVSDGSPPFDTTTLTTPRALEGVFSRQGTEVRFSGEDLNQDPGTLPVAARTALIAAQTTTDLIPNADRYRFSTTLRIDRMERRSPNTTGLDTGFFINVDLGNGPSGDFTIEFANDFRGRRNPDGNRYSIYFSNSLNGNRRRVGAYTPGDNPLDIAAQITADTGRLRLSLNGEAIWRGDIDFDTSIGYTPTVTMTLVDTVNVRPTSGFSSVSVQSLQSYYNPEPGTVMIGMAGLGLLMRRRR